MYFQVRQYRQVRHNIVRNFIWMLKSWKQCALWRESQRCPFVRKRDEAHCISRFDLALKDTSTCHVVSSWLTNKSSPLNAKDWLMGGYYIIGWSWLVQAYVVARLVLFYMRETWLDFDVRFFFVFLFLYFFWHALWNWCTVWRDVT